MSDLTAVQARILSDIAALGFAAVEVMDPTQARPPYAYTIGLHRWGWPDLLCAGLPPGNGSHLLASGIAEMRERRVRVPAAGLLLSMTVRDRVCRLARIDPETAADWAGLAHWLADRDGLMQPPVVVQVLWADDAGALPDDPRCDPVAVAVQTLTERAASRLAS